MSTLEEGAAEEETPAASEDAPVLELEDVKVQYREEPLIEQALPDAVVERFGMSEDPVQAVDGVSLEIEEEDVIVLVGESGSGKTSLGRTAIGLQEPTEGSVRYKGYDLQAVERGEHTGEIFYEEIRRHLQIIHQDANAALNPYRSVRASLAEPLKLWYPDLDVNDRRERILTMLRTVGMTPAQEYIDRYPHELSGGEKQRVATIRAMLVEPDVILADEIVSALDVSLRVEMMDLLHELQDMIGTSYIFISHNLTNARYFAERSEGRIAVMYLGRIVEVGPPEEVVENPKHPYTKILKWASLPLNPGELDIEEESPVMSDSPPDPRDPPSGCRFHPACPYAREECTRQDPRLMSEDDGDHESACFRELPDHEYWDSEPIHEDASEIPER